MSFAYQPLLAAGAALQAGGSAYTLTADAGSATIAGQSVQAKWARRLATDNGAVDFNGRNVLLARSLLSSLDSGSVALTGQQANFLDGFSISVEAANISVSGYSALPAVARKITVDPAAFNLSGNDAIISDPTRLFAVDYGDIGMTGQSVGLPASRYLQASHTPIGFSGSDINIMVDAGTVPPSTALNFGLSLSL